MGGIMGNAKSNELRRTHRNRLDRSACLSGTHTTDGEQNYLMIAECKLPNEDTELDARKYDDERQEAGGGGRSARSVRGWRARGAARGAARTAAWARTGLSWIESGDGSRSMSSSFEEAASLVVRDALDFSEASGASAAKTSSTLLRTSMIS